MTDERVIKLQPTQRDPARVMIRVGGERARKGRVAATLPRQTVNDLGITIGDPWDADLEQRVEQAAGRDKAYRYACNALGRRGYSSGEMIDRIIKRGHERQLAEAIVERLKQRGYLDDLAYARAVIQSQMLRKPAGPRLLRHKLYQKKVPRPIIDQVLAEHEADEDRDPVADARKLVDAKRRLSSFQKLDPQKQKQRLWGMLARRGFGVDVIRRAIEQ
jgi:regulatory protein